MKKPRKNEKFSHYNAGQPWLNPKSKKPQKIKTIPVLIEGNNYYEWFNNPDYLIADSVYLEKVKKSLEDQPKIIFHPLALLPHQEEMISEAAKQHEQIAKEIIGGVNKSAYGVKSMVTTHDSIELHTTKLTATKIKEAMKKFQEMAAKFDKPILMQAKSGLDESWKDIWDDSHIVHPPISPDMQITLYPYTPQPAKVQSDDPVKYQFTFTVGPTIVDPEPKITPPKMGFYGHDINRFYLATPWSEKEERRDRAKAALQFMEKEDDSLLIAIPEHVAVERRKEHLVKAMTDYADTEFTIRKAPLERKLNMLGERLHNWQTKVYEMQHDVKALRNERDALRAEVEELRTRRAHITSMQIKLGERPRQFRED